MAEVLSLPSHQSVLEQQQTNSNSGKTIKLGASPTPAAESSRVPLVPTPSAVSRVPDFRPKNKVATAAAPNAAPLKGPGVPSGAEMTRAVSTDTNIVRSFFRCMIAAQAMGLDRMHALVRRILEHNEPPEVEGTAALLALHRQNATIGPVKSLDRKGRMPFALPSPNTVPTDVDTDFEKPWAHEWPALSEQRLMRLHALVEDLIAVHGAYTIWKVELMVEQHELSSPGTQSPPASTPILDKELVKTEDALAMRMRDAISRLKENMTRATSTHARVPSIRKPKPDNLQQEKNRMVAVQQLLASCFHLRNVTETFDAAKRASLEYDNEKLLPWISEIFFAERARDLMHHLIYGSTMALREVASICRWVLRNQVNAKAKNRFKGALSSGIGFEKAIELLRYGRDDDSYDPITGMYRAKQRGRSLSSGRLLDAPPPHRAAARFRQLSAASSTSSPLASIIEEDAQDVNEDASPALSASGNSQKDEYRKLRRPTSATARHTLHLDHDFSAPSILTEYEPPKPATDGIVVGNSSSEGSSLLEDAHDEPEHDDNVHPAIAAVAVSRAGVNNHVPPCGDIETRKEVFRQGGVASRTLAFMEMHSPMSLGGRGSALHHVDDNCPAGPGAANCIIEEPNVLADATKDSIGAVSSPSEDDHVPQISAVRIRSRSRWGFPWGKKKRSSSNLQETFGSDPQPPALYSPTTSIFIRKVPTVKHAWSLCGLCHKENNSEEEGEETTLR